MDVPNTIRIVFETIERIAATECIVPSVKTETDKLRIGLSEETIDLLRCFYKTGAMMVEYRPNSGLIENGACDHFGSAGEDLPSFIIQRMFRSNTTGIVRSDWIFTIVIGENDKCRGIE